MKLKKFLIESDISKALDLPEPEVGEDYPSEKAKRYIDIIDKALESMKSKEENDSNDAIVADLRDKKKKWSNVDKETKPTKVKKDIPPEQQQADDPDVANPPPEEEPPPEDAPEEEPPPEEEEEEPKNGKKKKKKKVPPQFQKKEDYDLMLMTPFEKHMKLEANTTETLEIRVNELDKIKAWFKKNKIKYNISEPQKYDRKKIWLTVLAKDYDKVSDAWEEGWS